MSADVVQNGVAHDEDEFHDAEEEFEDEEQEATLIKKNVQIVAEVETAKEDDRTEDQVPDISGTENVGDQMTISVDEIEEIPAAEDGDVDQQGDAEQTDVPDQLENGDEEGAADIPVDVMGGATQEDQHPEEAAAEVAEDAPIAEEDVPEPEEAPVEETKAPVDEAADEEPQAEDEEPPVQEEEQKQQEPAQHEGFQLQDPPTPKRPRTPNQLDGGDAREDAFPLPGSQPQTPKSSVRGSQPSTPAANAEPVENGFPTSPRRTSNVSGVSKRSEDVPQTPKSPASSIRRESNVSAAPKSPASSIRRESNASSVPKSPLANGSVQPGTPLANGSVLPGTPTPATPRSGAIAASPRTPKAGGGETPKTKTEFVFEEASPVPSPKSPKKTTFEEDILSTSSTKSKSKSPPKSPPKSPRSPRKVRRAKLARSPEPEAAEPEVTEPEAPEPEAEAAPAEEPQEAPQEEETPVKEPTPAADEEDTGAGDEAPPSSPPARSRARVQSPSPPPRASARAEREPAPRDYVPYDQDSHRETVPARLPTSTSFSSWVAPERQSYQAISPWVNTAGKYRNEHTTGVPEHTAAYTSFFDDLVSTGPFSHSLYATSRLLERSRSRTRERRSALRSQRSASNYYRFASQFPPPLRTRDYSTPPTSAMHKAPGRAGSFISFMDYSGSKNYDLARNASRGSLYDSNLALSRTSSRGNIDYYLGSGRISRVDSYVNNLNSRYEWQVPSNYETYRSASRSHVAGYTPINDYTSYSNPLYQDPRRVRETGMVRSMYEGRIDDLQRNLSRERYERDRLRSRYTMVASQLEQACKQMDLLRTNSYAFQRSGSTPRTSVYANFYPYY